jgi:hypothetical protein
MRYFNSLPFLTSTDANGNTIALRNILIRTQLIPQLAKNPLLFYAYSIQDGDTPEIIANKYYGDPFRYWITLFGNPNIMDPQADWPMDSRQFLIYLNDKYGEVSNNNVLSYVQGTVHHYEKIITTIDGDTGTTAIKTVEVDFNTYTLLMPSTQIQTFSNGSTITYTISKNAVSIYDYENDLNESKRNINLINSSYANQVESRYQALMKA